MFDGCYRTLSGVATDELLKDLETIKPKLHAEFPSV
jgi:hypothetical protein